jgi:hypothetical protein
LSPFAHKKIHKRTLLFGSTPSSTVAILTTEISLHARLLPELLRSWTGLLRSDTYRSSVTSITAILFQFVAYLLTAS